MENSSEIDQPSRTSVMVAAARAVGAREPDLSVRNPDYLAEKLMGPEVRALRVDHPAVAALDQDYAEAIRDPEVASAVGMMMVRTRFIDELLERSVRNGATQVVVLGAGFDSRAYRFEELLQNVRVFEVDRATTQAIKKRRVAEALGGAPPNLTYVPIDFRRDNLAEVLDRAGFHAGQKTFFIWEGVTMYLTEKAARHTLELVASQPSGSSVVFDYVYAEAIAFLKSVNVDQLPEAMKRPVQRLMNLEAGEPWLFGIPSEGERTFLKSLGLDAGEILRIGGEEAAKRYLTRSDGTPFVGRPTAAAPQRSFYFLIEARVP
jgi:methyltransferase (TIGR00027 family)